MAKIEQLDVFEAELSHYLIELRPLNELEIKITVF